MKNTFLPFLWCVGGVGCVCVGGVGVKSHFTVKGASGSLATYARFWPKHSFQGLTMSGCDRF